MLEELQEKVSVLEKEVAELKAALTILKQTHIFDTERILNDIDKLNRR